ncbi:MAG: hypothetical protein MUC46_09830 [Desulfobacterales bacterium]|nr:hypothetical protein [Desulfobacterales bacterium]
MKMSFECRQRILHELLDDLSRWVADRSPERRPLRRTPSRIHFQQPSSPAPLQRRGKGTVDEITTS